MASAVSWMLLSRNERNFILSCQRTVGDSKETAGVKPEEGGDDVKSHTCPGLHTCYLAGTKSCEAVTS